MFSLFTFPKTGFSIKEHFLHTMHESTYIVLRLLQVNKSQKLFFLKLHCPKNERNIKVPSLKEVNFGKVKLWAVEHFWTDFDLRKRRDNKMDQISD